MAVVAAAALLGLGLLRPRRARPRSVVGNRLARGARAGRRRRRARGRGRPARRDRSRCARSRRRHGATARGFVVAPPSTTGDKVAVRVATADGRLQIEVRPPVAELSIGDAVSASGVIRDPSEFERARLERLGIRDVLAARSIEHRSGKRAGVSGLLDEVRRPRRSGAQQRYAGCVGEPAARLRPRPGRAHRRGHGGRLQGLGPRPPPRRLRAEHRPLDDPRRRRPRGARRRSASSSAVDAGA